MSAFVTSKTARMSAIAATALLALIVGLWAWQGRQPPDRREVVAATPEISSIALLPLANLTRNPEQEYFIDGMTEALITDLSKIGALKVIARSSVMRFKGTAKPASEVAAGSVLHKGDRVGITAQLIDGATDETLWADGKLRVRSRRRGSGRAVTERRQGHPELMEEFKLMQQLVERTPTTVERLSPEHLSRSDPVLQREILREYLTRKAERNHVVSQVQTEFGKSFPEFDRQDDVLRDYLARRARKEAVVTATQREFGKPFAEFTNGDYAHLLESLDLNRDEDLWKWSHVTGIPVVGLSQKSIFFYCNAHLLEDVQAAVEMPYAEVVKLERGYDQESDKPTLHTADGQALKLRDVPAGTIRRRARTGRFSHDENYAEPRIVLEALAPYLVPLEEVPNRQSITRGLQALPLSIVKAYRGKAIYLTTQPGRSYSVGMPISNSVYMGFAGMQAGIFVDHATGELTTHNLVHELGHVIDYTVIVGLYGTYVHPYQFPAWRELKEDKDRVYGEGDSAVTQTNHGYVSSYAKSNAQESFAEHFAFYILQRDSFRTQAEREQSAGHPELMAKYRFLETLIDRTAVTALRLSRSYLESLEE